MGGSRRPHGEVQAYHPQTRRNRQVESAPGARHGPPSPPRRTDRGCTARYQEARNRKKKRTKIEHHLLAPQVCQAHLPRPVGGQRKRWRRGAYRHRHPHNAGTARSGHPRRRHHRQARAAGRCGGSSGAGGRHKRRRGRRPRDGDRRGGSGDKRHQSNGRGGIGGGGVGLWRMVVVGIRGRHKRGVGGPGARRRGSTPRTPCARGDVTCGIPELQGAVPRIVCERIFRTNFSN